MAQPSFYLDWNGHVQDSFVSKEIPTERAAHVRSNPLWKCDAVAHFFYASAFSVSMRITFFSSQSDEKNQHQAVQI